MNESNHPHPKLAWDRERRQLFLGNVIVKEFKWPAENQEAILVAFEDLGWPNRIDDPLKAHPTFCPKQRLHDALKNLNRKGSNAVKFRGDGTGRGIILELRPTTLVRENFWLETASLINKLADQRK